VLERMCCSESIEQWEIDGLKKWWKRVTDNVVLHHRQEEQLVFPKLKERITFPPKVSADHVYLLKLMGKAAAIFDGLESTTTAEDCLAVVDEIEEVMLPHMIEEEETVLPGMMEKFTPDEVIAIESDMSKEFDWCDMPHFYRPFGNDLDKKRQHAQRSFGKPGFVFASFVEQDFVRYEEEYGTLLQELLQPSGERED